MKFKLIIFFIIFTILSSTICFATDSVYVWSKLSANTNNVLQTVSNVQDNNSLNLESGSAILIEQTTGKILYSHNGHQQLRPASVTKVMSILLIMEALDSVSANDCTVAMAEYIGGSEEAFVQMMNTRAKQLGMNDTVFKNCHGIDEDGHVTSSYDIALMSKELLNKHPEITEYTTIWMDSIRERKI